MGLRLRELDIGGAGEFEGLYGLEAVGLCRGLGAWHFMNLGSGKMMDEICLGWEV